jgi:hypothetical protein
MTSRGQRPPSDKTTIGREFGEPESETTRDRVTIESRKVGLADTHRKWLIDDRGIDPDVAMDAGCYSAILRFRSGKTAPAFVTPCIIEDREVAWTARFDLKGSKMKGFIASEGAGDNLMFASQIWEEDYTVCTIDDVEGMPALTKEKPEHIVVLTEGQLDALSCRMAGFVGISVPNGARSTKWLEAWAPKLANLRRLVLWLDDDEDGRALRAKLLKDLWEECAVVTPREVDGKSLKDANDVLKAGGISAIREAVLGARLSSVGKYDIIPSKLLLPVKSFPTGLQFFDERMLLCSGEHTALVGRAGRGKSLLANFLAYKAARHCGEMVYFQSMENVADGELTQDLAEFEAGIPVEELVKDPDRYRATLDILRKHVVALEPARAPRTKSPFVACLRRIIRQARNGVRLHVLDNYAMVASYAGGANENAQTRQDIIEANEVCRRFRLALIICYHARKGPPQYTIPNRPPELEDASGSAAIGNHCCLGMTIERVMEDGLDTNVANMAVRKARRRVHGRRCDFNVWFNFANYQFEFGGDGFKGIKKPFEKKENKGGAQMSLIKGGRSDIPANDKDLF